MSEGPRVVVLGGGPGGDVAALRAAQMGAQVTLVERADLGGTCLNWGCIPTKALLAAADLLRKIREAKDFGILVGEVGYDFAAMMARKEDIVTTMRGGVQGACERKGVTVLKGQGIIDGDAVVVDGTRVEYDHLVVATGTEPAGLPGIDMDHPAVLTSNDILVMPEVPETLLILGAGVIGCEFASLFQPLGVKVTMVEMLPRILAGIDNRTAKQFQKYLAKDGAEIHLGRRLEEVTSYSDTGVTVKLDDGTVVDLPNKRLDELLSVVEETDGKLIIWANYRHDIEAIKLALSKEYGMNAVGMYYGDTDMDERKRVLDEFQNPDSGMRFFVGNPSTGGYGLTLTAASTMVYYSNSFDLEKRLQSEDRAHRIGQTKNVTYIDLIAVGTVDEKIVKALRAKIDIATQVLGEELKTWLI